MTTKKKRGPVIKTDWVFQYRRTKALDWITDVRLFFNKEQASKASIGAESYYKMDWPEFETRIIERKWRVVG